MSLVDALVWIQTSRLAHAIAESNHMLVASLQIVHVFGFIFLLAPLILISLRVFGWVLRDQCLDDVLGQAKKLSWLGLAMAVTSGLLMFLSAPLHYYSNWAFDAKIRLMLVALFIYVIFFIGIARRPSSHPRLARLTICLSILAWVAVCMAGRAIGFV
jgi:hypothetical protein